MKHFIGVVMLAGLLFLFSCGSTEHLPGPVMSDNHATVEWVFPDNKKYGVIKMGDDKWFPYYDKMDILRWNDVIYDVPQYGRTDTYIKVANSNRSTNVYLYEHKLSRHRAVSYVRMITIFGESDSDRGF